MDEIQRVYEELNRPSAAELNIALHNQGIDVDAKEMENGPTKIQGYSYWHHGSNTRVKLLLPTSMSGGQPN